MDTGQYHLRKKSFFPVVLSLLVGAVFVGALGIGKYALFGLMQWWIQGAVSYGVLGAMVGVVHGLLVGRRLHKGQRFWQRCLLALGLTFLLSIIWATLINALFLFVYNHLAFSQTTMDDLTGGFIAAGIAILGGVLLDLFIFFWGKWVPHDSQVEKLMP